MSRIEIALFSACALLGLVTIHVVADRQKSQRSAPPPMLAETRHVVKGFGMYDVEILGACGWGELWNGHRCAKFRATAQDGTKVTGEIRCLDPNDAGKLCTISLYSR